MHVLESFKKNLLIQYYTILHLDKLYTSLICPKKFFFLFCNIFIFYIIVKICKYIKDNNVNVPTGAIFKRMRNLRLPISRCRFKAYNWCLLTLSLFKKRNLVWFPGLFANLVRIKLMLGRTSFWSQSLYKSTYRSSM